MNAKDILTIARILRDNEIDSDADYDARKRNQLAETFIIGLHLSERDANIFRATVNE